MRLHQFAGVLAIGVLAVLLLAPALTSAATLQAQNRPWAQQSRLVGYWSFDGKDVSGTTLNDRSDGGNDAVSYNTPKLTPGKLRQGIEFNGTDDCAQAPADSSLNNLSALTVTAWVNPSDGTYGPQGRMVQKGLGSSPPDGITFYSGWTLTFGVEAASQLMFGAEFATAPVYRKARSTAFVENHWQFVTVTWDGSTNASGIRIYRDGNEVMYDISVNGSGARVDDSADDFYIGCNSYSDAWIYGSMDEVRVYNRVLSQAEIKALANAGQAKLARTQTGVRSGLVSWWTFDGKDIQENPVQTDTGWVGPVTSANTSGGAFSWNGTGNILYSDDARASTTLSGTSVSDYLYASNFGFSIPAGSTILGVEADIERRRSGGATGQARDSIVRLVDDTGTIVGTNKAYAGSNWPSTVDDEWACSGPGCYGGAADLWGTTLTATQVNDPDFGFVLAVTGSIAGTDRIAEVDRMELRINYQGPGGAIESVSAYHGTLTNGPQRVPGKVGQALDFFPNGADTDAYVDVGDINALDFGTGDITMSAWVNVRSHVNQGSCCNFIFGKYSAASGAAPGYGLFFASFGLPQVVMHDGTNDGNQIGTTNIIGTGWHHIVGVRSGTTVTLYVDSVVEDSGSVPGLGSTSNNVPLLIGTTVNAEERNINGAVDDVRIYNRALSAQEVKTIFNEGVGTVIGKSQANKVSSGLVGYWSFNGPDFTDRVYDRSGQGNHGYVIGVATSSVKAAGRIGQAIRFTNQTGQYIRAGTTNLFDGGNRITATSWVRTTSTNDNPIVVKTACNGLINNGIFELGVLGTGYFYIYKSGGGPNYDVAVTPSVINDGQWHHLAGVYDGTYIRIYLDGIEVGNKLASGWTFPTQEAQIEIGACQGGNIPLEGSIDEVRVYDRALSAQEVKQLYLLGR